MSFILDALKKSETDRQRQSTPALFEVKVAAPRRRFPMWAAGLAALLGLNVLVLAWVLLRGDAAPQVSASPTPAPEAAPSVAATAPRSGEVTVPATVTFQVNVPANSVPGGAPPEPQPGVVAPSPAPPLAEEPLLSGQAPAVPPDYDARDYQPAITADQAHATAAARRAGLLPSRDDLLSQGKQLPDLKLDLHVYDADAAKRFVFINMRKLREGDSLPDGTRVVEITPEGVQLDYQGNQFSMAGN